MLKYTENALSKEHCQQIINSIDEWENDVYKRDINFDIDAQHMTKDELEANTVVLTKGGRGRKVQQSEFSCFDTWDGLPVYRSKVMKYEEGDYTKPHRDSLWMCQSNYWKEGTNKTSKDIVIIPLNDDYEGGQLSLGKKGQQPLEQKVGQAIQFPQDGLELKDKWWHGVEKVTKGTRYALVFWNFRD